MNPKSARALAWLAGMLLLGAAMIPAPVATVAISALTVVAAIAPVVSGSTTLRIASLLVLSASLWLAVATVPEARNEMAVYRARAADPIPASEYAVYETFFRSRPAARPNGPQFFEDVPRARLLAGHTLALGKDAGKPDWPARDLRGMDPYLAADYRAKNAQEWTLTDRIDVPDLVVISRKELDAKLDTAGVRGLGVPRQPSLEFHGGYATLSRVGFNSAGDTALFKVALTNPGTMHTSYLVLMRKRDGAWILADVTGQEFMIR